VESNPTVASAFAKAPPDRSPQYANVEVLKYANVETANVANFQLLGIGLSFICE
jgi:hypothetical protein